MRISLHIDIIITWFKDIDNPGGLVLFFVFYCKMRYVTDYLQIVPYFGNNFVYNNIPKNK